MKTTSKILVTTLLLGGAAAVALPVLAQTVAPTYQNAQVEQVRFDGPRGRPNMGQRGPGHLKQAFDTNKDGTISADEISAKLATYDTNKDGSLSLEEYKVLFADLTNEMMVRSFQFLDKDGNAIVTEQEFAAPIEHMQQRMADNRDRRPDGPRGGYNDHGPRGDQGQGPRDGQGPRGDGWRPWH